MTMARAPFIALLPQFSVIVEKNGVEIARNIVSAVDETQARATFFGATPKRFLDPWDKMLVCRVEKLPPK
jgi:hypothetical protein